MQFDSLDAFLAMGGYGFYVWLSFGVCFASMLILAVVSKTRHKQLLAKVLIEKERQARIKNARAGQKRTPSAPPLSNPSVKE